MNGWIDEVTEGFVWGRLFDEKGQEFEFHLPILSVLDDQRVDLEPGRYCSIVNNELLIDKTIWTTNDVENAKRAAQERYQFLWGSGAAVSTQKEPS